MTNEKIFTTRDLYLAASLITLKFHMQGVDYQVEGSKLVGYFNFIDNNKLRDAVDRYRQGQLAIEPKMFITNMRELKAAVTTEYKSPTNQFSKAI